MRKTIRQAGVAALALPVGAALLATTGASAAAGGSAISNGAVRGPGLVMPAGGGSNSSRSNNWSGYVKTGKAGSFNGIKASWKVPAVKQSGPRRYSSTWVGIDGWYGTSTLIQCGTEEDSNGTYRAWWEMLPAAETPIALKVVPGNEMTATVKHLTGNSWIMSVVNHSRHWTFSRHFTYKSPRKSMEVIEEATQVNGSIGHVADFHKVFFSGIQTLRGGKWVNTAYKRNNRVFMVTTAGKREATPALVGTGKHGQFFWVHYNG